MHILVRVLFGGNAKGVLLTGIRLGVLQNDAVTFDPELPTWKQEGIETFFMETYTKIFLQFPADKVFCYQFFLYADPEERGYPCLAIS
jgi:polyamine oxidase